MESDRWRQIEQLYHEVSELEPARRGPYLQEFCAADSSLRREVESLLAREEQAQGFIEVPALEYVAQDLAAGTPEFTAGQTLGRYRILSLLGKGGMGVV